MYENFPDVLGTSEGDRFYQRTETRKADSDTEILQYYKQNMVDIDQDTCPNYCTIRFSVILSCIYIYIYIYIYLFLLTYLLHGAESFLRN